MRIYYQGENSQVTIGLPIKFPNQPIDLHFNFSGDEKKYFKYQYWFWNNHSFGYRFDDPHDDSSKPCSFSAIGY